MRFQPFLKAQIWQTTADAREWKVEMATKENLDLNKLDKPIKMSNQMENVLKVKWKKDLRPKVTFKKKFQKLPMNRSKWKTILSTVTGLRTQKMWLLKIKMTILELKAKVYKVAKVDKLT